MSAVVQSPQLAVRPMTEADLDAVMKVELAMYPFPWTRRIFVDCLRVGYRCFVGEVDGEFAGYGVMSVGAGEAHVLNICVAKEFQQVGLGRCLLNKMLEQAAHFNVENVFLEVRPSNTAALKLYEQAGFNQIGVRKDYYPADNGREDALVMAISLVPWGSQGE
jgi:ribosomal-protein-alanine N-acetyltransferase